MWMMIPATQEYSWFDTKPHSLHKADAETFEVATIFLQKVYLQKHIDDSKQH